MTKHTYALLYSILFHIILIALFYYIYTFFTKKEHIYEKMISVRLSEFVKPQEKIIPPQIKKQTPLHKPQKEKKKPLKKRVKKIEKKAELKKLLPIVQPKVEKIVPMSETVEKEPEKEVVEEVVESENLVKKPQLKEQVQKKVITEPQISEEQRQKKLEAEFLNENMVKITKLLQENLYYPRSARKRGVTGEILVVFSINRNGEVTDVHVEHSNSAILSRAAKKTIVDLSGEFPKPKEKLILHLPISYRLD